MAASATAPLDDLPPGQLPLPGHLEPLKSQLHRQLVSTFDQDQLERVASADARRLIRAKAAELLSTIGPVDPEHRSQLLDALVDDVLGLGPIEPLLRDAATSEIMVNGPTQIWVERRGRLYLSPLSFRDESHIQMVIDRILGPLGRHVDEASPMVDARLPDGSRVNIVVPPAAPGGAKITLRKFSQQRLGMDELVSFGTLSPKAAMLLQWAVECELNILISGGTGSGKTTLLNALSSCIGESERIITIEDPLELQLQQPHVVALEARPPAVGGEHQITQRDLVRNALRMRPDRIVVGEVRGSEAFDMLQAMNTGHSGSLSTVHANTPRDALRRIENMVLMAGYDLPNHAIREQMVSALQLVIQIARLRDGSRRVTYITEVAGLEGEAVLLQDLFTYDGSAGPGLQPTGLQPTGLQPTGLQPTGLQPQFAERVGLEFRAMPREALRRESP